MVTNYSFSNVNFSIYDDSPKCYKVKANGTTFFTFNVLAVYVIRNSQEAKTIDIAKSVLLHEYIERNTLPF